MNSQHCDRWFERSFIFSDRPVILSVDLKAHKPALLHISRVPLLGELFGGGIHVDVTQAHTGHAVVINGANVDALQIGQSHHEVITSYGSSWGVLPVFLRHRDKNYFWEEIFLEYGINNIMLYVSLTPLFYQCRADNTANSLQFYTLKTEILIAFLFLGNPYMSKCMPCGSPL